MIVLLVTFTVERGHEERALGFIREMQQHTRKEPGCVKYTGHQSNENPRKFFFYEVYKDEEALAAHRAADYFKQYVTHGLDEIIESRERDLYKIVS